MKAPPFSASRLASLRAHLEATIFPPAAPAPPAAGRPRRFAYVVAFLLAGTLLELLRPGWSASMHSIWAEDGSIFLHGALTESFGATIFAPYANYLVVVPRLIAEAATAVPLDDAAAAISVLSALLIALSGLVVWYATEGLVESRLLRAALAAVTVLAPVSGLESLDSASYVSWYMLFAVFWILLWQPKTLWGAALAGLFVLATGLSNPGIWFFIPLAALRAIAVRDERDGLILGSFAIAAIVQIPVAMSNHEQIYNPTWSSDIPTAYLQRVLDGAVFGQDLGGGGWSHLGWGLLIPLALIAAAILVAVLLRGSNRVRYLAVIAVVFSLALFFVSLYQRAVGPEMVWPSGTYNGSGGRYVIVPAMLLISAGVVVVDAITRGRNRRPWATWLSVGAAALLLLGVVTSFDMGNAPVRGVPTWEETLEAAAGTCVTEGNSEAKIPVAPVGVS